MPTQNGITCTLLLEGQKVAEYTDPAKREESDTSASCYIESKDNATFSFAFDVSQHNIQNLQNYAIKVYIDGILVRRVVPQGLGTTKKYTLHKARMKDSRGTDYLGDFKFISILSAISNTARETLLKNDIGTIKIEVYEARINCREPSQEAFGQVENVSMSISEKAVEERLLSHRVVGVYERAKINWTGVTYGRFFASFVFKYKSLKYLKSSGIAPIVPEKASAVSRAGSWASANIRRKLYELGLKREQELSERRRRRGNTIFRAVVPKKHFVDNEEHRESPKKKKVKIENQGVKEGDW